MSTANVMMNTQGYSPYTAPSQSLREYAEAAGQEIHSVGEAAAPENDEQKELKKKVQAAYERWLASPEYELHISERARKKAEALNVPEPRQSAEEAQTIRDRSKYQYATEYLGITTNRYGYAGIMEKAGSAYANEVGTDRMQKTLDSLDKKYAELSDEIHLNFDGDEAEARLAELKDNYRAMLEDTYNRMNEKRGIVRGEIDAEVHWNSVVGEADEAAVHNLDTDELYRRNDENDKILDALSGLVKWGYGQDFDPESDSVKSIKDMLVAYDTENTAIEDEIFRAAGQDPDWMREKITVSRMIDGVSGFSCENVPPERVNALEDAYQKLMDEIEDSGLNEEEKTSRRGELNKIFSADDSKQFLLDIIKEYMERHA